MPEFKHFDYNQMSMVMTNYLEQTQPGTFEFALHYLISETLDLSVFHQPYKNDAEGRSAYDPAILLKTNTPRTIFSSCQCHHYSPSLAWP